MSALHECVSACGPSSIRKYFENAFKLNTCAVNEHAFSLMQASKQKKTTARKKKKRTSKQNEENKGNKLTLTPQPSLCLFVSENHISSAAQSGEQGSGKHRLATAWSGAAEGLR